MIRELFTFRQRDICQNILAAEALQELLSYYILDTVSYVKSASLTGGETKPFVHSFVQFTAFIWSSENRFPALAEGIEMVKVQSTWKAQSVILTVLYHLVSNLYYLQHYDDCTSKVGYWIWVWAII